MPIVVAYTAGDSGTSALELASVLSRSTDEPLVVAVVVTTPHAAGAPEFVDGDYLAPLTEWANSVLDTARERMPSGVDASFEVHRASSIPAVCSNWPLAQGHRRSCWVRRARGPWGASPWAASPTGSSTRRPCRC